MTKPRICKRKDCKREVLPFALLHNDPFCSTICFRLHHETTKLIETDPAARKTAASKS